MRSGRGSRWWPSKERGWKRGFPERPWPLSNDAASLAFLLTASHMVNLAHDSLERQNLEPRPLPRPLPRPHSPRKTNQVTGVDVDLLKRTRQTRQAPCLLGKSFSLVKPAAVQYRRRRGRVTQTSNPRLHLDQPSPAAFDLNLLPCDHDIQPSVTYCLSCIHIDDIKPVVTSSR